MAANRVPLTVDTSPSDDFDLGSRFADLRPLGFGVNGLVVSATDIGTGDRVAIKRLVAGGKDAAVCRQVLREVRILRRLSHENVVGVHDVLTTGGRPLGTCSRGACVVYIVQELMVTDLEQLMACGGRLAEEHICLLFYQLLRALKYVHSANVLHRDVKPANLLVDPTTMLLKLADFSLARVIDPAYSHQGHLSETMGTSWYRAPELILAARQTRSTPSPYRCSYNSAVDLWAAGCVLSAMLNGGRPLLTASGDVAQLRLIVDAIPLSTDDWHRLLAIMPNRMLRRHPMCVCRPLAARCHDASHADMFQQAQVMTEGRSIAGSPVEGFPPEEAGIIIVAVVDLLKRLLTFNPCERMSAELALSHPFLAQYSCTSDEPVAENPLRVEMEVDDFESTTLRQMIYNESILAPPTCGSYVLATTTSTSSATTPNSRRDEERTLDEIFRLDDSATAGDSCDVMRQNLRNSSNRPQVSSPSIEEMSRHETKEKSKVEVDCGEEKDVAEISQEKEQEDMELIRLATENITIEVPPTMDYHKEKDHEKTPQDKPVPQHKKAMAANQKEAYANSQELDDRYRLPTAHLRRDCDYSNERLKRYRGHRGRLRPEPGAYCHLQDDYGTDDVTGLDEPLTWRQIELDRENFQRIASRPWDCAMNRHATGGGSSPDEPASPRSGHRSGARPKKISKKQRAL